MDFPLDFGLVDHKMVGRFEILVVITTSGGHRPVELSLPSRLVRANGPANSFMATQ